MSDNPYQQGQCTYRAAELAPWVLRYGNLGNARTWYDNWTAHGGAGSLVVVVGAVACFENGADGSDATDGHVAFVQSVQSDGTFTVEEANFTYPLQNDTRSGVAPGPNVRYLLEQEIEVASPLTNAMHIFQAYKSVLGRGPNAQEAQDLQNAMGSDDTTAVQAIQNWAASTEGLPAYNTIMQRLARIEAQLQGQPPQQP